MRPFDGVLGSLDDGVLRGRVGAQRWLLQAAVVATLAIACLVMTCVFLFGGALAALITMLLVSMMIFGSMRVCMHSWAWTGVDYHVPVIFDLQRDGLEVGEWRANRFEQRRWPIAELRDLRIYKDPVDCSTGSTEVTAYAMPMMASDKADDMPTCSDAVKECFGSCWRSCMSDRHFSAVSGVFMGAKVQSGKLSQVVRLSRNVWTLREVDALMDLARRARELVGFPEEIPASLVGAAIPPEEEDVPLEQLLPSADIKAQSVLITIDEEPPEVHGERSPMPEVQTEAPRPLQMPTEASRSPEVRIEERAAGPRPKMKSKAARPQEPYETVTVTSV